MGVSSRLTIDRVAAAVALMCVVLTATSTAHAQRSSTTIPGFSASTFTRVDGLPQNGITALASTPDGFLWIGTQAGLARFDGVSFVTFDKRTIDALKDHFVTSLAVQKDGTLWIGTRHGLIRRGPDGSWNRHLSSDDHGSNYVRSVSAAKDGGLVVGTYGSGISTSDPADSTAFRRSSDIGELVVRAIFDDSLGKRWLATSDGLICVAEDGLTTLGREDGLPGDYVRSLTEGADGDLWIGSENGGLSRLANGRIESFSYQIGLPEDATVWALLFDHRHHLWVGTEEHGVRRLRADGYDVITSTSGLASDLVWSLHEDSEGSIWVGTRAGLTQLKASVITTLTTDNGLSDNRARTVLQDTRGRVWIGTMAGLDRIDPGEDPDASTRHWLHETHIRSLMEASDGSLWVGTDDGIVRIRNDRLDALSPEFALTGTSVNALTQDQSGCIWVGTGDGGLSRACNGIAETIGELETHVIRALLTARNGDVWIGSEAGLAKWSDEGLSWVTTADGLPSNFVYTIHEDATGDLWLGTTQGLVRYGNGEVHSFSSAQGLPVDLIFQILEDESGHLWLSTQQGIVRVDVESLHHDEGAMSGNVRYTRFDESDGMVSSDCYGATQPAGAKLADGRLMIPTYHGVAVVDPRRLDQDIGSPTAVIDRFTADGIVVNERPPAALTAGTDEVEIHFTAPSFVSSRRTNFRYRMDGYHQSWIDTDGRRVAHFANLSPGHYVFRVIASNDDGVWSEKEATLAFEIKPYFWQTRWFLTLAILAAVVLGPAIHRYRVMSLAKRQRELEEVVARRTTELADANQKLEKLATIDGLTELANHRHFRTVLRNEWQRHIRSSKPLSILIIDVDHFKLFNDRYGHLEGDRALRSVARVLSTTANRPGDLAARHGGEEFSVILSETGVEGAREVAEKIRREINDSTIPHESSPVAPHLTVSIGTATIFPTEASAPDTLVGAADNALYQAKNNGRNQTKSART